MLEVYSSFPWYLITPLIDPSPRQQNKSCWYFSHKKHAKAREGNEKKKLGWHRKALCSCKFIYLSRAGRREWLAGCSLGEPLGEPEAALLLAPLSLSLSEELLQLEWQVHLISLIRTQLSVSLPDDPLHPHCVKHILTAPLAHALALLLLAQTHARTVRTVQCVLYCAPSVMCQCHVYFFSGVVVVEGFIWFDSTTASDFSIVFKTSGDSDAKSG